MKNKPVYEVFSSGSKSIIGYLSTKGKIKIFESFELDTQSFTLGPVPGNSYGSNTSYQQVVNKKYWELETGMLFKVDLINKIDQLSKKCPALLERMRVFKSLRSVNFGVDNINYYNQVCANENPFLIEPSKLVIFRKKGGQKDVIITVFVNGEQYGLSRNSLETIIIENAIDVKICTENEDNCIIKTFSPDRVNFVEISLRKKESQTKIDYVESSYGALETRWIKASMK